MDSQSRRDSFTAHVLPYGLVLFMGLAWGLSVSLSKIAGATGAHPIGLAQWQVTVAALVTMAVCLVTRALPYPRADLIRFGLVCGAVGIAFPAIALFEAAKHLPAGIVAIAFATLPLFTYLMSVAWGLEGRSWRRFLGVVIGLAAMAMILLPQAALPDPDAWPWVVLALVASVSMSFENFFAGAFRPRGVSSFALSFVRQLGAMTLLTPLAVATGTLLPLFEPWGATQWAATGTGLISGIAFSCLLYVIATSGAVFATQSAYVITLAGVGWGMILFAERHSAWVWLALALTLIAVAMVRPEPAGKRRP
jgi:drug/metabolite transporter (DMT)-like permease